MVWRTLRQVLDCGGDQVEAEVESQEDRRSGPSLKHVVETVKVCSDHQRRNHMKAAKIMIAVIACIWLAACGSNSSTMDMSMEDSPETMEPSIVIPATIIVSPVESRYAQTSADTIESMTGMKFGTISVGTTRWSEGTNHVNSATVDDRAQVTSITKGAQGDVTIEYVVDGDEGSATFTAEQIAFEADDNSVITDMLQSWSWEYNILDGEDNPIAKTYYDLGAWEVATTDHDNYWDQTRLFAYGVATVHDNLPVGTASYEGFMYGDLWDSDGEDIRYAVANRQVWAPLTLGADLDANTISGSIDSIWVESSGEDGRVWMEWSESGAIAIAESPIVDGQFAAAWAGSDTASDAMDETSIRGFTGDLFGTFFGPAGEEVAGVISGHRAATATTPNQVIVAVFGAEQQ